MRTFLRSFLTAAGIAAAVLCVTVGVLAPREDGRPVLHIHAALGRSGATLTGCLRHGVSTWVVGEVILYEILDSSAARLKDPETGFTLLEPKPA